MISHFGVSIISQALRKKNSINYSLNNFTFSSRKDIFILLFTTADLFWHPIICVGGINDFFFSVRLPEHISSMRTTVVTYLQYTNASTALWIKFLPIYLQCNYCIIIYHKRLHFSGQMYNYNKYNKASKTYFFSLLFHIQIFHITTRYLHTSRNTQ